MHCNLFKNYTNASNDDNDKLATILQFWFTEKNSSKAYKSLKNENIHFLKMMSSSLNIRLIAVVRLRYLKASEN